MAVKRFLLLGSLLLSSVLFGFPDQPSHLPKPRPERRKDIIDFNGASHLYFRFTENGKDANRELLDGFWERAHSTAANLAAYNRETRPEVRQTMRLGSSILIAVEGVVLIPGPEETVDLFLETNPYELYLGRIKKDHLANSTDAIHIEVPTLGGSNELGGGSISGTVQLKWDRQAGVLALFQANIDVKVSLHTVGDCSDRAQFKDLKSDFSPQSKRRPKPLWADEEVKVITPTKSPKSSA